MLIKITQRNFANFLILMSKLVLYFYQPEELVTVLRIFYWLKVTNLTLYKLINLIFHWFCLLNVNFPSSKGFVFFSVVSDV
jgi:hypothetical protein